MVKKFSELRAGMNEPARQLADHKAMLAEMDQGRVKLGSLLADMGRQAKLSDEEFAVFEHVRDKAPARPVSFE